MERRQAMQRLRSGEPWWQAELAVRGLGVVLLVACAADVRWLSRLAQGAVHQASGVEFVAALLAALCWFAGWAALGAGPGLFRRVELPGRYAHFDPPDDSNRTLDR